MTDEQKRKGNFDPECIADIRDVITQHNYALRALGELLKSSDLDDFADEELSSRIHPEKDVRALNLRWGLSQLIELCLDRQESIIGDYADQYYESDIYKVKRATDIIAMFEHGAFTSIQVAIEQMRENINNLNIVISRNGELKNKALHMKDICLNYIGQYKGKQDQQKEVRQGQ